MALVILALVGVAFLGVDTAVILDVLEGVVHETSVASIVSVFSAAVDEVLLGEADEAAGGAVVHGLQRARGGEGPAAAALALVLDGGDGALGPPVHVQRLRAGVGGHQVLGSHGAGHGGVVAGPVPVHHGHKLVVQQVTKLVHSQGVAVSSLVEMSVVLGRASGTW